MSNQTAEYESKIDIEIFNGIINNEIVNYPKKWYKTLVEYLDELIKFKVCWEKIWTSNKFRFGSKASDLAIKYTLPVIRKTKAEVLWDLGAGTGRDSIFFTKFCREVACIEISKAANDTIKERASEKNIKNIKIINDDVWSALKKQNSIRKGFVDIVHAHSFLHYTKPLMTDIIFSEIYDLLRSGGYIVFAVKGKGDHLFRKGKMIAKDVWIYEDGQRRKFYDEAGVEEILNKTNFEIKLLRTEKEYFDNKISEFVIGILRKP